jgi:hypothetical protein
MRQVCSENARTSGFAWYVKNKLGGDVIDRVGRRDVCVELDRRREDAVRLS